MWPWCRLCSNTQTVPLWVQLVRILLHVWEHELFPSSGAALSRRWSTVRLTLTLPFTVTLLLLLLAFPAVHMHISHDFLHSFFDVCWTFWLFFLEFFTASGYIGRLFRCPAASFLFSVFCFVFVYLFLPPCDYFLFYPLCACLTFSFSGASNTLPAFLFSAPAFPECFSSNALFHDPVFITAWPWNALNSIIHIFIVHS